MEEKEEAEEGATEEEEEEAGTSLRSLRVDPGEQVHSRCSTTSKAIPISSSFLRVGRQNLWKRMEKKSLADMKVRRKTQNFFSFILETDILCLLFSSRLPSPLPKKNWSLIPKNMRIRSYVQHCKKSIAL